MKNVINVNKINLLNGNAAIATIKANGINGTNPIADIINHGI